MVRKKENIVMYFSMFGKNEKIADIISMELSAFKLKIATSGWGILKIPIHMIKGILERDVIMIPRENLKNYKVVFIGGPVWAGKPCPALADLIKKTKLKDKDVVLFLTAGGDFGQSEEIVRDMLEKKGAKVKSILKFYTNDKEQDIKDKFRDIGVELF